MDPSKTDGRVMWVKLDGPTYLLILGSCSCALDLSLASLLSARQSQKSSSCYSPPQNLSLLNQPREETLEVLDWQTGFICAKGNKENDTEVSWGIHLMAVKFIVPVLPLVLPSHLPLKLIAMALSR